MNTVTIIPMATTPTPTKYTAKFETPEGPVLVEFDSIEEAKADQIFKDISTKMDWPQLPYEEPLKTWQVLLAAIGFAVIIMLMLPAFSFIVALLLKTGGLITYETVDTIERYSVIAGLVCGAAASIAVVLGSALFSYRSRR
jgi:hypothetical protein